MLQRLAYKLQAFMYGRNGVDQLGWALLILGLVLNLIGNFTGLSAFCLLAYLPMLLAIYRMFSKNLPQRQKENAWFFRLLHRDPGACHTGSCGGYYTSAGHASKPAVGFLQRLKDRDHRYFRCPKCRQTVRVPAKKGVLRITCPRCGERFEKKT